MLLAMLPAPLRRAATGLPGRAAVLALGMPCLLLFATGAAADIYKCETDKSTAVYQDTPCPKGRELRDFQADPPTMSVVPFHLDAPSSSSSGSATDNAKPPAATSSTRKGKKAGSGASNGGSETRTKTASGDPAERKYLRIGMSEAEVVTRIGEPDMRSSGTAARRGPRWSYLPNDKDPQTITTLTFSNGMLSNIERRVVR
jgi:hypothetical protein